MPETRIKNEVSRISIEKLVAHPDSPNRMSKSNFAKLTRNIKRTGQYEPLVVRPCPGLRGFFQIINGHHRFRALGELGYKTAEVVVWDIDDREADMLLLSINRLRGSDLLDKKLTVLNRLNRQMHLTEMAKLLPFSRTQIERLTKIGTRRLKPIKPTKTRFADPLVFFVDSGQKQIIENALSLARDKAAGRTKAEKNATALACIAECFNLKSKKTSNSEETRE